MKRLLVKPTGGLCNRLRAIDSAIAVANAAQCKLVVIWEKNAELNCSYHDLFVSPGFELHESVNMARWHFPLLPTRKPKSWFQRVLYKSGLARFRASEAEPIFFDDLSDAVSDLRPITPDRFSNVSEFDREFYQCVAPLFKAFQTEETVYVASCWRLCPDIGYSENFELKPEIQNRICQITDQFSEETIGLHIRGTDAQAAKKYCSLEAFQAAVDQEISVNPAAKFFLATDEPKAKSLLLGRYPERIHFLEQEGYARSSNLNIQNALVDLMCLANTKKIFGSYFSTFSQLAADWFGREEITVFHNRDYAVRKIRD